VFNIEVKKKRNLPKEDILSTLFRRPSMDMEPKEELTEKLDCEIGKEPLLDLNSQQKLVHKLNRRASLPAAKILGMGNKHQFSLLQMGGPDDL
jgi:hypothetical protein